MNARAMDCRECAGSENRVNDYRIDSRNAMGAQRSRRRGEGRAAARDVIDDDRVARANRLKLDSNSPITQAFFRSYGVVVPRLARDRLHKATRFLVRADHDRAAGVASNPCGDGRCRRDADCAALKDLAQTPYAMKMRFHREDRVEAGA